MSHSTTFNGSWLLQVARTMAMELQRRSEGTCLRIRMPRQLGSTHTDGWCVRAGDLGSHQPKIELWLDRYSGHKRRKLWIGFFTEDGQSLKRITSRVSRNLIPVRRLTDDDYHDEPYEVLRTKLSQAEFGVPILEFYNHEKWNFFGIYGEPGKITTAQRALDFWEEVARSMPDASPPASGREVYPQEENRRRVISHLQRERSGVVDPISWTTRVVNCAGVRTTG